MCDFVHLHNHTQFSLLDGASDIGALMAKAKEDKQTAVAITDHGNMYGAFKFVREAHKNNIKPILGCEFYLVEDRFKTSFRRSDGEYDVRNHQLLLAKNAVGYTNLSTMCSLGFVDGLYGKYPRIDKEIIEKYHEGIIATSCCIAAEIPQAIVRGDMEGALSKIKWWQNLFGDDFYIELMRHGGMEDIDFTNDRGKRQRSGKSLEDVNQILIQFAEEFNIDLIATNDAHYVNEEDHVAHDILLCVNTGNKLQEEKRFRFPSSDYYFKTQQEMKLSFQDIPSAIENTLKIVDKVEELQLERDVLLPNFPIPDGFKGQQEYLRHLTFEGARKRYGEINSIVEERLNYELDVIRESGYPGYFLIVQDFTQTARDMSVAVGPGRGSAAGSAVAYCLGITNIDPIKYDLLFERFLNPERISMPDIDIDFDDVGRQKVIDYVVDKYGKWQVAQIVTYSTMGAKSALRDVGRVMDVSLNEVNNICKAFPTNLKAKLKTVLADGDIDPKLKSGLNGDDLARARSFRQLAEGNDEIGTMITTAKDLEGSVRNTGIHACGVIITPDNITKYVPVCTDKTTNLLISQFDNSVAEDAGLLKMDFLGLRTLSIIKDAVDLVKHCRNEVIQIEEISLEDELSYQLFQRGETVGIFQYESEGMQKHMKDLKPTNFEDLIAMNALYRPGPIEYIPNFINRKHGKEEITYDLPEMKPYLESTYGITVYQEQVMLLSQKLAGFTKGQADMLRKGMGKKKKDLIDELYPKFIEGGKNNGHDEEVLKKIWKDWEAFASYAFNKSHSTCYAFIAFQTAYLKAHYPAEFMASVLTHHKSDITKLSFFLDECNRLGIKVLGPSVNESYKNFTVTADGDIRFGMSAIKGVGEKAVEDIISDRAKSPFKDIFDFVIRLSTGNINKKGIEGLVLAGAFDCFEDIAREQYLAPSGKYDSFLDHLIRYGAAYLKQKEEMEFSLFGATEDVMMTPPEVPEVEPWSEARKLQHEKEVIGIFASGHPLDAYKFEIKHYVSFSLDQYDEYQKVERKTFCIAGIVTNIKRGENQRGNGYVRFDVADYKGIQNFGFYQDNFMAYQHHVQEGAVIYIKGSFSYHQKSDRYYFNISDVGLLETLGASQTSHITLGIPLQRLDEQIISELLSIFQSNPGPHKLFIKIIEAERKVNLEFLSEANRVEVRTELINDLDQLGIPYRLNK